MNITVTGTRRPTLDKIGPWLVPYARPENHFYVGGAIGADSIALDFLATKDPARMCRVTVVVPRTLADQPIPAQRVVRTAMAGSAQVDLVELRGGPGPDAFHARNRHMVDRSQFVIGFPQLTGSPAVDMSRSGGTWATLRYASGLGLPMMIIPV